MSDKVELRRIADARELLEVAELTGVIVYEIHGRRNDPGEVVDDELRQELKVMARGDENRLETRIHMRQHTDDAALLADIGVEYTLSEPCDVSESVLHEFVERVGVMAVFPFLRESLVTTASRLGVNAPVLGLLHAGSFRVDPADGSPMVDVNP